MDNLFRILLITIFASLLAACATARDQSDGDWRGIGASVKAMEYAVKSGDSLAAISRKLTGSIDNWEAIADFNSIPDPSLIQVGDIMFIPAELLSPEQQGQATKVVPVDAAFNQTKSTTEPEVDIDMTAQTPISVTPKTTSDLVFQRSALPGAKLVAVTTRPVIVNRTFTLSRASTPASRSLVDQATTPVSREGAVLVEVAGSDNPKSIFAQPFNHSPLLMQAKPGATFTLDQQLGEWLRINTDKGAGYIRRRDAKMIGASYTNKETPTTASG